MHTKGPWNVDPAYWRDIQSATKEIATVDYLGESVWGPASMDEAKANAHLIAAAPDLLAALRALNAMYDHESVLISDANVVEKVHADARAAINKAEGK